ncbi:MAG: hypothetical protein ACFFG0_48480 [Candidatus Thorarchaeota archaeon]
MRKKTIPVKPKMDGCKVKVHRDKYGRIRSIESNGKCTKSELDIFRENLIGKKEEDLVNEEF